MSDANMTIRDMLSLCAEVSGIHGQLRVTAHECRKEFEYIDFVNLFDKEPRKEHRIKKFHTTWVMLF